ncbi:MAG: class III extradiol ring-cleavage dioxygenase [Azovibrio sp.]|uniref:DODA-type extradiol aromatic ring-opening family dioxygenase n=1 Tax=Azovibrio sp. TaxID=1872673 RepID=UPI003C76FC17
MPLHPVLFVSHGAPDLLLHPGRTGALWAELGQTLPRPRAILAVSAHWGSSRPVVSATPKPETLHDFSGFPAALYQLRHEAPGAPDLAPRVQDLLSSAGLPIDIDHRRGLDHGAWVPLQLLYPAADIPVTQLSLQPAAGPEWHLRLGEALAPLRQEGVLILASGAITHNFGWLSWSADAPPYGPAREFSDWVAARITAGERHALLDYRRLAPHGSSAHPTEEHLHPLFVALGAGKNQTPRRYTPEFIYGGLAMDVYLWDTAHDEANQQVS